MEVISLEEFDTMRSENDDLFFIFYMFNKCLCSDKFRDGYGGSNELDPYRIGYVDSESIEFDDIDQPEKLNDTIKIRTTTSEIVEGC